MRMNKLLATLILLLALAAPFAQAQLMPTEKLDGIVAVLDGDVILRSELERQVATVQAQYANNPQQLPPRAEPVTVYGPPGTGVFLEQLAALYGAWLLAPGFPLTVRELVPDEIILLADDVRLRAQPVPHTAESVAYSVAQGSTRLVYTGDTGYDDALADWASGCDVLLAECSLPDSLAIRDHLTPRQVGALAARANARRLVLTHFYPPVESIDIVSEVAEQYAGPVDLATDGWSIEF